MTAPGGKRALLSIAVLSAVCASDLCHAVKIEINPYDRQIITDRGRQDWDDAFVYIYSVFLIPME
jgi:hypothetical protein